MGVDGRQADMEAVGDLLAHQSADHEREHLHLARGEGGTRRVGLGRRQVATARVALLHKAQHLADERLLGHAHTEVAEASQLGVGVGGEGQKCWGVKDVDVYMPAATQNDVNMEWAKKIAESGVKYYIEVANMPTTNDALNYLRAQKHMVVAPSKAVNAGGVGVSGLEMSQNSERLVWTAEEVDAQLHKMMKNIHKVSAEAAEEYGLGYDLVAGANIAGFKKVAQAMYEQGVF